MDANPSNKQILIYTLMAANVLLIGLIWATNHLVIPKAADAAISHADHHEIMIRYEYELEKITEVDKWQIEHYREYEITKNHKNEVLSKKPTSQTQHMKYWIGDEGIEG